MDTPQAPAAPDPAATAAAQSAANKDTAIAQYGLNATNQNTPTGSLSYKQIGTWSDGTPRYEATTSLNSGEQSVYDTGLQTRQNVAGIGRDQSARIASLLGTPVDLSNEATESRLMELGSKRLDPRFARESDALETNLINRGIRPGSKAYDTMRTQFDQGKNDAYNQLLLTGRGQAVQEALTERNQPINEITALMGNSQVSQPNFTSTPSPGVAPTDVIGAQQQSLNQQNVGYQGALSQNNAMMSGLFGLGGAGLGGWAQGGFKTSDARAKENITRVGQTDKGLPIYTYSYKGNGGLMEMGVMAQDLVERGSDAVAVQDNGLMAVDYGRVAEVA
ncbi:tail fiber domain-containing protein [Tardiphaga sp. 709]|uniref:tail fiber domain-containing protein n=1 Tax=Tardiphaga sp. 709 TaxID=3076039 RepID=UPI0028E56D95|nr:tail fiber domain-containing protein [Tardiphaga sp. 709]WNV09952.1 tail fiber domain-containing protein [Tardiphaga sp. 709]